MTDNIFNTPVPTPTTNSSGSSPIKELTVPELTAVVPKKLCHKVTQDLVDKVNAVCEDPYEAKALRENIITFSSVLDGNERYDLEEYLNAATYVSFKLMGMSNYKAYSRTFPERIIRMQSQGYTTDKIGLYVNSYNKTKLVNAIREAALVPVWILNADAYQEAINTQVEIMRTAKSDAVRMKAADSILNHLKRPEATTVDAININVKSSGLEDLKNSLMQLAEQQRSYIKDGTLTPKQIANMDIIEAQIKEVD